MSQPGRLNRQGAPSKGWGDPRATIEASARGLGRLRWLISAPALVLLLASAAPGAALDQLSRGSRSNGGGSLLIDREQAMGSPWWENYDVRHSFLCPGRGTVVVERNDSQASLLSGGFRSTLFRDPGNGAELSFSNGDFRLILHGDELTLEQSTLQITCIRTEEA